MIAILSKNNEIKTQLEGTGEEILEDLVKGCMAVVMKMSEDDDEVFDIITNDFLVNFKEFAEKVKLNNFTDTHIKM